MLEQYKRATMPTIENSNKLSFQQEEYRVCSKPYVFYRLISNSKGLRLMTATASEDTGEYRAYDRQSALIDATASVLADREIAFVNKQDHAGRDYIETSVDRDPNDILHLISTILDQIGFEDISVLALREMKAIYDEFAIDGSGEDTYLSDGMWMTSDGRLVEK